MSLRCHPLLWACDTCPLLVSLQYLSSEHFDLARILALLISATCQHLGARLKLDVSTASPPIRTRRHMVESHSSALFKLHASLFCRHPSSVWPRHLSTSRPSMPAVATSTSLWLRVKFFFYHVDITTTSNSSYPPFELAMGSGLPCSRCMPFKKAVSFRHQTICKHLYLKN